MVEFVFIFTSLSVVILSFCFLWVLGITPKEVFLTYVSHIEEKLKTLQRDLERMGK